MKTLLQKVGETVKVGMAVSGAYTMAYMCTKKSGCSHAPEQDPVMRIVRGVTGAVIGGYVGRKAGCWLSTYIVPVDGEEGKNE